MGRQLEKADTAATGSHSGEKLKRCQNWCCVADGEEHGVRFRKVLTCWKEYGGGGSQLLRMSKCRRELLLLLFLPHLIFACKRGPSHKSSVVVRHLPKDVTLPLAEHQSLLEGELLYARFKVPESSGSLTALVTATWIEDHMTAPVWLFLRKDQLPERGNAQWTDVFYRGRRSSRIQVSDAAPGTYYLLLECRQTLHNLGLTLTIGDTDYLRRMEELKNGQLDIAGMEHINEIDI